MNTTVNNELHLHNVVVRNFEILDYNNEWGQLQHLKACNIKILNPDIMSP